MDTLAPARNAPGLVRLPVRQGTPEWLAVKRTGISSTDAARLASAVGLTALWAEKVGLADPEVPDAATQELFDLAHDCEPVIAAGYTRRTGRPLKRVRQMVRHPTIPWAFASLDYVSAVPGERRIVECKWAPHRRWDDGPEPVPAEYLDQVQWELLVTRYPVADVAVLARSHVESYEIPADAAHQDALLHLAEWFRGLVERRERPPMDGSEETRRALVRMHPRGDGDVIRAPSTELDELARELHRQEPEAKAAADAEATTRNAIRAILGDAAGAEGQGYRISYRQNRPSARTDWQAVAESLAPAVGSGPWADAVAAHTSAQDGPRVLRVTFGEEARSWP